jgi:hypothetical protein
MSSFVSTGTYDLDAVEQVCRPSLFPKVLRRWKMMVYSGRLSKDVYY